MPVDAEWMLRAVPQAPPPLAGIDRLQQAIMHINESRMQSAKLAQQQAQFAQQQAFEQQQEMRIGQQQQAAAQLAQQKLKQDAASEAAEQNRWDRRFAADQGKEAREAVGQLGEAASAGDLVKLQTLIPAARAIGIEAETPQIQPDMQPIPQAPYDMQLSVPDHLRATGLFQQPEPQLQLGAEFEPYTPETRPFTGNPNDQPPMGITAGEEEQPQPLEGEPPPVELPDVSLGEDTTLRRPDVAPPQYTANQDAIDAAKNQLMLRLGKTSLGSIDMAAGAARNKQAVMDAMGSLISGAGPEEGTIRERGLGASLGLLRGGASVKDAVGFGQNAAEDILDRDASADRAAAARLAAQRGADATAQRAENTTERIEAGQAEISVRQAAKDLGVDKTIHSYLEIHKAMGMLKDNPTSPIAWAAYRTAASRAFGDRGASTEGDIERGGGMDSRSWLERVEQMANQAFVGGASDTVRRDAVRVATSITDEMARRLDREHQALRSQQEYYEAGGPLENPKALARVDKYISTLFKPLPFGDALIDEGSPHAKRKAGQQQQPAPAQPAGGQQPVRMREQPGRDNLGVSQPTSDRFGVPGFDAGGGAHNPEIDDLLGGD